MAKLIDVFEYIKNSEVMNAQYRFGSVEHRMLTTYAEELLTAPTVDAEPVVHGHWEWGSAWYPPTCSVCNLVPLTPGYVGDVNFYERYFKRCPNCGADMRGGDNT